MSAVPSKVLIIDDNIGDVLWLFDFLEWRGYKVEYATNEVAARARLSAVQRGVETYSLAIIDVMIAIDDIETIDEGEDTFYEKSMDTGIRLCRYARRELGLSEMQLPIACLSARDDEDVKRQLGELGVQLFNRAGEEIRDHIARILPDLRREEAKSP